MLHINWVMVVVSAVCQWILGVLWYGVFFRKSWTRLVGLAEGERPKNAAFAMLVAFIACLLLSFVMAHVDLWAGPKVFTQGVKLGVICWVGFIAPTLVVQHIFEGRRANLFAINVAYWALAMALGSGLLAAIR
jgi:hypothetical protein